MFTEQTASSKNRPEHKCTLPENSDRVVRVTLQREVMTTGRWAIACSKADDTTGSDDDDGSDEEAEVAEEIEIVPNDRSLIHVEANLLRPLLVKI